MDRNSWPSVEDVIQCYHRVRHPSRAATYRSLPPMDKHEPKSCSQYFDDVVYKRPDQAFTKGRAQLVFYFYLNRRPIADGAHTLKSVSADCATMGT